MGVNKDLDHYTFDPGILTDIITIAITCRRESTQQSSQVSVQNNDRKRFGSF
jgi:hypothetical protein